MLKTFKIGAIMLMVALVASLITYQYTIAGFQGSQESLPFYIGAPQPYSYIIDTNTTHYVAFNGTTGFLEQTSTDADSIVNTVFALNPASVFFRSGTYTIDSNLLPNSNVTIRGESTFTTIILRTANASGYPSCFTIDGKQNVAIRDLTLQWSDKTVGTSRLVRLVGTVTQVKNVIIENVNFKDASYYGISLVDNVDNLQVRYCNFTGIYNATGRVWIMPATTGANVGYTNIRLENNYVEGRAFVLAVDDTVRNSCYRWSVNDNYCYEVFGDVIHLLGNGSSAIGNKIVNINVGSTSTQNGIDCWAFNNVVIMGNTFYTECDKTSAIFAGHGGEQVSITGNSIENKNNSVGYGCGIYLFGGSNSTVSGNVIKNMVNFGVGMKPDTTTHGALFNLVIGNRIDGCGQYGIYEQIYGILISDYNVIAHNHITSCATSLITTGNNTRVEGNAGYNPKGYIANTVLGSYLVDSGSGTIANNTGYTCTQSPKTIYIGGGTVLNVYVNGQVVFATTNVMVYLSGGNTFEVEWSSAPTIKVFGQ